VANTPCPSLRVQLLGGTEGPLRDVCRWVNFDEFGSRGGSVLKGDSFHGRRS